MTITVRAATLRDYPVIRDVIATAFKSDDEARLWDHLVSNDPALQPEGVRVAVAGGRPVACTVVLPRRIRTRRGWTPGAVITLVACIPELQGQGYGSATVADAVAYLEQQGLALGILYGHPGFYPRFGFVPVLPSTVTTLPASTFAAEAEPLEPAGDFGALAAMYNAGPGALLCAVARTGDPWLWETRNAGGALLTLPGGAGYVFAAPVQGVLNVYEAAGDPLRLAGALCAEALRNGLGTVRLVLPASEPLTRLMAAAPGAHQEVRPAGPGMAVITRWDAVLPQGYTYKDGHLRAAERTVAAMDRDAMTQLALGYLAPEALAPGLAPDDLLLLQRDFPAASPKWSLAPFWH